jgi:uncharacterized protein YutE (UPF0331/DUF86 family)
MSNDVMLHKISFIEHYKKRVLDVYAQNPENLKDLIKQDSIILNIQRAIEACVFLAMYIVSQERPGLPQTTQEAFDMLQSNSIIDEEIANRMKAMVDFRNIAIRDYQDIDLNILQQIIDKHIEDFTSFTKQISRYY